MERREYGRAASAATDPYVDDVVDQLSLCIEIAETACTLLVRKS
jgi:hypothetical protein